MNEATPIDDHLLAKYIAGEADVAEQATVQAWVAASSANAQELDRMRVIWDLGTEAEADVQLDAALRKVQNRIAQAEGRGRVIPFARTMRWAAAAAVVTGLILVARWWFAADVQQFASERTFTKVELADGSDLVLSPNTSVKATMGKERKLTLEGEAYFQVAKDKEHPFVIDADGVEVTVLGTAFTVSAYDTSGVVLVRVREGRVQVVVVDDTLVLGAGDHARFDKQRHLLERAVAPPMERWGDRILQFERAPLPEVMDQLQRLYAVRIELGNEALANCTLTATFEEEPIERILEVISETYGLTLTRGPEGAYLLNGDGC